MPGAAMTTSHGRARIHPHVAVLWLLPPVVSKSQILCIQVGRSNWLTPWVHGSVTLWFPHGLVAVLSPQACAASRRGSLRARGGVTPWFRAGMWRCCTVVSAGVSPTTDEAEHVFSLW